jgi:hypothetical protein
MVQKMEILTLSNSKNESVQIYDKRLAFLLFYESAGEGPLLFIDPNITKYDGGGSSVTVELKSSLAFVQFGGEAGLASSQAKEINGEKIVITLMEKTIENDRMEIQIQVETQNEKGTAEMNAEKLAKEEGFEYEKELPRNNGHIVILGGRRFQIFFQDGAACFVGHATELTNSQTLTELGTDGQSVGTVAAGLQQLEFDPEDVASSEMDDCYRKTLRKTKEFVETA